MKGVHEAPNKGPNRAERRGAASQARKADPIRVKQQQAWDRWQDEKADRAARRVKREARQKRRSNAA